jgi:uncharacterized protein YceK
MKYALILITLMFNTNGVGTVIHASSSEEAQYLQRMAAAQAEENDREEGPAAPPPSPADDVQLAYPIDEDNVQIGRPIAPVRRGIDFRRGIDWEYYR